MNKVKKISSKLLVFALPIVLVGTLLIAYIVGTNKKENENKVNNPVNGETMLIKRKVYLKNSQGLLVPLTINIEPYEDRTEEIKLLISKLKNNVEVQPGFKGLLDQDVELLNVEINDSLLTLDFNESFNKYEKNDEIRIIESLVWTCSQYRDISQIKILVNGVELTKMPVGNCPVPRVLDNKFGINNHIFTHKPNMDNITVYYEDVTSKELVYVPVTIQVEKNSNQIKSIVNALEQDIPTYSSLKKAKVLKQIEFNELPSILNDVLNIDLTASSLVDETTVDKEIYEYLVMSFRDNISSIESVNILVQDEIMNVNGYKNEIIPVTSIYENIIEA